MSVLPKHLLERMHPARLAHEQNPAASPQEMGFNLEWKQQLERTGRRRHLHA
jgi:hypothetical protein